jgi:hypothetical protein
MTLIRTLTLALLTLALACAADIDGKWRAEFESQIGPQKYTFELKAEGDKLTGKAINDQRGAVDIKEGRISGDEVFFVEELNFEGNAIRIELKGKIVGDELRLNRKVGDFANYDIVAKRMK